MGPPPFGGPGSPPMGPPPFGGPGSPPMGPPPFGGPGSPPPSGGGQPMPMGPPPSFSPAMPGWQSGSEGIRRCIYRNTYIWLRNGKSFWFFPTFVSRNMVIGFRWRRFGWTYSTIHRNNILSFQCF
ncbi:hypothetical protein [Lysinibacillus sp. 54212]|uniref:hypothetical protein n=1 Tax=Lysinibacillus sp. 54212 TaxID=3119829 RepID=UPI002FC9BF7A